MHVTGRVAKTVDHLQVSTCEKESEERRERGLLDEGEKGTPLLIESCTSSRVEDY